jgi:hypothetical protein
MFWRIFRFWAWKLHQHFSDLKLIVRSITELRLLNYFRHQNAAIHLLFVSNWELDEEGRRKTEKNRYPCTRQLRVLLLGIGNWELGIGNWELGIGNY